MNLNTIFRTEDYPTAFNFATANGYTITELEPDDQGRRFQIVEINSDPISAAYTELMELEDWFMYYDKQTAQYQRCLRLGLEFDKDIVELDNQAVANANRINELRSILANQ